jgi:LuxR family maltose regulon positive regulatory protein
MISPVVLILDDVHLLHDSGCRAALPVLARPRAARSRLVLAGRTEPPVRIARLRAEGRLAKIGRADLSLTVGEAASLLCAAEVVLGQEDVAELHRRTEDWPVGLCLAALCLQKASSPQGGAVSFGGDDRFVSKYVVAEFLARISSAQRVFLTRTAVLERMSGSLCEAVLEVPESAAALAGLARSNPAAGAAGPARPVVPLPPPVSRPAPGGAGTDGARPAAGLAPPRRGLVPGQ